MPRLSDSLFIGVGGHVVAIDRSTGQEIWRTKVKMSSVTTVSIAGDRILAGAQGELCCLDAGTGSILWRNKLRGLGMGVVLFPDGSAGAIAAAAAQAGAAAAAR
ncbi:MAG: PQQ-binding-like beta-propeller repeat protein [Gemmatimonadales bacterium]